MKYYNWFNNGNNRCDHKLLLNHNQELIYLENKNMQVPKKYLY